MTLPLYALVTQMGSTMKPTVFNDQVVKALHKWHQRAKRQVKLNRMSDTTTPGSSRPSTPSHWTMTRSTSINDSSQRVFEFHDTLNYEHEIQATGSLPGTRSVDIQVDGGPAVVHQHKIDVDSADFSFDKYIEVRS